MLTQKIIDGMHVYYKPDSTILLESISDKHFKELVLLAYSAVLARKRVLAFGTRVVENISQDEVATFMKMARTRIAVNDRYYEKLLDFSIENKKLRQRSLTDGTD